MIIIGERLNSTRRAVLEALRDRDEEYVVKEARAQQEAGAAFIDVNAAALLGKEIEALAWVVPLLQSKLDVSLAVDTPNLEAMETGLRLHKGQAFLNSLTGETERVRRWLPLIREHKPRVIVLCLDDEGLPTAADKELAIATRMAALLEKEGVSPEDIFLDPLVRPVGVDQNAAKLFLESLEKIKKNLPLVKTVAGISNVSFGLPERRLLNRTFLVLALERGLDAAIVDPLDSDISGMVAAARALAGGDPSFRDFLAFARRAKPRRSRQSESGDYDT